MEPAEMARKKVIQILLNLLKTLVLRNQHHRNSTYI